MKAIAVDCQHCGAPLNVGAKTRFVTCKYCTTRLQIVRTEGSVYTEVLEQLQETTDQLSREVQTLKLQNALQALDREWQQEREQHLVKTKDGGSVVPNPAAAAVGAAVAALFGIFFVAQASRMGAPGFFPLFGLCFILFAVVGAVRSAHKSTAYRQAESAYRARRRQLESRLENSDRP